MIFKKYGKNFLDQEIAPEAQDAVNTLASRPLPAATAYFSPLQQEEAKEEEEQFDEQPDVTIGEGVLFKGELRFDKLLRLDGTFEGTIESGKKIIVGPKGCLKASVNLDEAFIAGKIEGDLCVKERLVLRGRAEVFGNITAPRISVDEGVSIVGQLLVSPSKTPEE